MKSIQELLEKLVAFPSITPLDAGCQEFMLQHLQDLGFVCEIFNNAPACIAAFICAVLSPLEGSIVVIMFVLLGKFWLLFL